MGRIRSIKPEFFLHEDLVQLEVRFGVRHQLRVLYPALWCLADREGRFQWRPGAIKAQAMPYDQDADVGLLLDALAAGGFVVRYQVGAEHYGWIPTFTKHQRVRNDEAASRLPEFRPEEAIVTDPSLSRAGPECTDHPPTPWKGKDLEGKGSGKELEGRRPQPLTVDGAPEHAAWADGQRAPVPPYEEIVEHLNARAGTKHLHTGQATRMLIRTLWLQGYSLEQFKLVIDTRCKAWKNDAKTREWLRPKTLFEPSKFESYLGAIDNREPASPTPDDEARRVAARMAITRTEDERRAWIRKQPVTWRRKLADLAGLYDWSENV